MLVHRTQAVDAAEALHDAHRVPVHVVIDHAIAVLEVLPLRNAIRCEDNIDLALTVRESIGFLRTWRETAEDILEATARPPLPSDAVAGARHLGARQAMGPEQIRCQLVVQVGRGVSEGAENEYFSVTRINLSSSGLLRDQRPQLAELGIPIGGHRAGVTDELVEDLDVA